MSRDYESVTWLLNQAGRHHLLTAEEELILSRQIQAWIEIRDTVGDTPTKEERRIINRGRRAFSRFFSANLRLVVQIAGKYTRRVQHLSQADLIQEGALGLIRGIEKFDATRGYKFSTYGYWWIRQSITRAIESHERTIRLPAHMAANLHKIRGFRFDFEREYGRSPTYAECGAEFGLTAQQVRELMMADSTVSLDRTVRPGDDDASSLLDLIPADYHDPLDEGYAPMYDLLPAAIQALPEKQQEVIQLRFFHKERRQPSLRSVGERQGVSRERIRQQQAMALNAIRLQLGHAKASPQIAC